MKNTHLITAILLYGSFSAALSGLATFNAQERVHAQKTDIIQITDELMAKPQEKIPVEIQEEDILTTPNLGKYLSATQLIEETQTIEALVALVEEDIKTQEKEFLATR